MSFTLQKRKKNIVPEPQQDQKPTLILNADKSVIPDEDKFSAIMDASASPGDTPAPTNNIKAPFTLIKRSSGDPYQDTVDEGIRLRTEPITDKDGRVKSFLKAAIVGAGQAANRALAAGSRRPLLDALGGAIGGGVAGAVHPTWNEENQRREDIAKNDEKQGFLLKSRKDLAGIKSVEAETQLKNAQAAAMPGKAEEKARKDAQQQLFRILHYQYPKGYKYGTDPKIDEMIDEIGLGDEWPDPQPRGGGFKPAPFQSNAGPIVIVSDGANGYKAVPVHTEDGQPLPAMSPYQQRELELRSESNQIQATRNNQFAGRRARRALTFGKGSKTDSIGESLEARDAARYTGDAATARAKAAELRGRGDDAAAAAWDEAARVADENANKVGNRRSRKLAPAQSKRNDPLGILSP